MVLTCPILESLFMYKFSWFELNSFATPTTNLRYSHFKFMYDVDLNQCYLPTFMFTVGNTQCTVWKIRNFTLIFQVWLRGFAYQHHILSSTPRAASWIFPIFGDITCGMRSCPLIKWLEATFCGGHRLVSSCHRGRREVVTSSAWNPSLDSSLESFFHETTNSDFIWSLPQLCGENCGYDHWGMYTYSVETWKFF